LQEVDVRGPWAAFGAVVDVFAWVDVVVAVEVDASVAWARTSGIDVSCVV
jgi:hypothetical protein